jgi:hypothetical protein
MNTSFANTNLFKRILMFAACGLLGIFTNLYMYQVPVFSLTPWEFLNTALVGLLVFELFHRARKWLNLKTLPLFIIFVTLISQWLYFLLYRIENGDFGIDLFLPIEPLQYLFSTFPYNVFFLIESCLVAGFAYYLIRHYKGGPVPSEHPTRSKAGDFAIGFFGWFLAGNLVIAPFLYLFYSAVLGALGFFALFTLGMIVYMFAQARYWIGTGIIAALITNGGFMALLGLGSFFTVFFPLPIGLFLLMQ